MELPVGVLRQYGLASTTSAARPRPARRRAPTRSPRTRRQSRAVAECRYVQEYGHHCGRPPRWATATATTAPPPAAAPAAAAARYPALQRISGAGVRAPGWASVQCKVGVVATGIPLHAPIARYTNDPSGSACVSVHECVRPYVCCAPHGVLVALRASSSSGSSWTHGDIAASGAES